MSTAEIQDEIQEWEALMGRFAQLEGHLRELESACAGIESDLERVSQLDAGEVEAVARSFAAGLGEHRDVILDRLQDILAKTAGAFEVLTGLVEAFAEDGDLGSAFAAFETTVGETSVAVEDAVDEAAELCEATAGAMIDDAVEAITETVEALDDHFASLASMMEEEIESFLETTFEAARDELSEAVEETTEGLEQTRQALEENVNTATQRLKEELEQLSGKWTETTRQVSEAYDGMERSIDELGQTIETIRDVTTSALNASGLGMNAASKTLEDMIDIMGSVV